MVVMRRPWHDNAHTMPGFAWRKLGNYELSLEAYQTALTLNLRHRGALEYLGEAYLDLDRLDDARATYRRLAKVCGQFVMGFDNNGWKHNCEELEDLASAFAAHGAPLPGAS